MLPQCLHQSFNIWFGRSRRLEHFKIAATAERLSPFLTSMLPQSIQQSFGLIQLMVWEELSIEEFQNGDHSGHLGYRNGMV